MDDSSGGISVNSISLALNNFVSGIENITHNAGVAFNEYGGVEFIRSHTGILVPMMNLYAVLLEEAGVWTVYELEEKIAKHFKNSDIQSAYDEWLTSQDTYNQVLNDIDNDVASPADGHELIRVGGKAPLHIHLQDVSTGEPAALMDCVRNRATEQIDASGGQVLVVTFGSLEGAKKWLQETKCPYQLLRDDKRELYTSMGLYRSVAKTWKTDSVSFYGEAIRAKTKLPEFVEGDDPHQMGGDLMLDKDGRLLMVHASKNSKDRPMVEDIVTELKKNQEKI